MLILCSEKDFTTIPITSEIYYKNSEWDSLSFGKFKIIAKTNKRNSANNLIYYLIKFEDGTIVEAPQGSIKKGRVKNPNAPYVCGIGYMGQGEYDSNKYKKEYFLWKSLIRKCYKDTGTYCYKNVLVANSWHNFQVFCKDIQKFEKYNEWKKDSWKWNLDKDIICEKENISPKIYSKETCMFITREENQDEMNYRRIEQAGNRFLAIRISDGYEEEFINQHKFAEKWGISYSSINVCCSDQNKTRKGWRVIKFSK